MKSQLAFSNDCGHVLDSLFPCSFGTCVCKPKFSQTCADKRHDGCSYRYAGSFSKGLVHDTDTGKLDRTKGVCEYDKLAQGLWHCDSKQIECVKTAAPNGKLADPCASFGLTVCGAYPCEFSCFIPTPPSVDSLGRSREYAELLLRATARDVLFDDYATDPTIASIVNILNHDLKNTNKYVYFDCKNTTITPANVFRGTFAGERKGAFISRFYTEDVPLNGADSMPVAQNFNAPNEGYTNNFMTTLPTAVAVQNGNVTGAIDKSNMLNRRISTLRDLADVVHADPPGTHYSNAALIMAGNGVKPHPYFKQFDNAGAFVASGGIADVMSTLGETLRLALSGAWYYKWRVHRTLRPEAYGIILTQERDGKSLGPSDKCYVIPEKSRNDATLTMSIDALKGVIETSGSFTILKRDEALLPQTYPEGSPSHPAYPAGHAVVAGALVTVLKALFDTETVWSGSGAAGTGGTTQYVDELDKLAANAAYGRNAAGVHYAADGYHGILLGEQIAAAHLSVLLALNPARQTYCNPNAPLKIRGFNGNQVHIYPTQKNHVLLLLIVVMLLVVLGILALGFYKN